LGKSLSLKVAPSAQDSVERGVGADIQWSETLQKSVAN
jgi:hypothetical protein